MPNSPAAYVELEIGAKAGAHAPVSACASGAEAIGMAFEMIESGRADVVVAGGTEAAIHPLPISAFAAMQALSKRNDDPAGASRPYDTTRDGFVLGEGAGIVVLESEEHARARGAQIYARAGRPRHDLRRPPHRGTGPAGRGPDARHEARARARGTHADRHRARQRARHLHACGRHGRGARHPRHHGLHADNVLLSATKSMTGHLLGGAGAVESVFTIKALQDRKAPPTINVDSPDPELEVDLVRDTPARPARVGRPWPRSTTRSALAATTSRWSSRTP